MDTKTFTVRFFNWIDSNNISLTDLAEQLGGVGERTIANWRSEGVPKRRISNCQYIIENHHRKKIETENLLNIKLTDDQLDLTERAAAIVQTPLRAYIIKAVTAAARKDIASHQNTQALQVAEEPAEYRHTDKTIDPTDEANGTGGDSNQNLA